jgi:BolA protein
MSDRADQIFQILERELNPSRLEVIDEGHKHVGHPGARDGRGHFQVIITAAGFAGLPLLQRHRLVYSALGDLMTTDIHALSIEARSEEDD